MSVIEWLLDSDPSIRWQVMGDLIAESDATVARAIACGRGGLGGLPAGPSRLGWPLGRCGVRPARLISTQDALQLLRDLGVDPASDRVRRAIGQVRERCTWGAEFGDSPFFEGEVRRAGCAPDERIAEAVDLVAKKRDENGRWPLENPHPGPVHFEMEGAAGEPGRWNTFRAL